MIREIDPIQNSSDDSPNDEDVFHSHLLRPVEGSPLDECKHKFLLHKERIAQRAWRIASLKKSVVNVHLACACLSQAGQTGQSQNPFLRNEDGKLTNVHPQLDEKKVPLHSISREHIGIVYETDTLKGD